MYRGRIRKFFLERKRNILVENAQDVESAVRFAIPGGEDPSEINEYIIKISPGAIVTLIRENVPNPVLSKQKINIENRYTL